MTLGGYCDTLCKFFSLANSKYQGAKQVWFPPRYLGATEGIVHLALAEKVVEKLAGFLLVLLNLVGLSVSFAPCIVQHGIQQVLLELPLFRLGELMKKLESIRLGRGMDVGSVTSVPGRYDGIISRSFSLICRSNFRLLLVFGSLSGSLVVAGATPVLVSAADRNDFLGSFVSGSRIGGRLRVGRRWLGSSGRGTGRNHRGVGSDSRRCLQKVCDRSLGFTPRGDDLMAPDSSKKKEKR